MYGFILPQLHPVTQLPVMPTVPILILCAVAVYAWGHFDGHADCLRRAEPWESRRRVERERTAAQTMFPAKDYAGHQPSGWVPKRYRALFRLRAAGRGYRVSGKGR